MSVFVSKKDSISKNKFLELFELLKETKFDELWKIAEGTSSNFGPGYETLCVEITPLIGRWFDSHGVRIGSVSGGYEWKDRRGFNYFHMFNVVYVDNEEWIIDGSYRQFNSASARLRYFIPNNQEYNNYAKGTLWSHESMLDWISWHRTKSGRSYVELPRHPLQNKDQMLNWGAQNWMLMEIS